VACTWKAFYEISLRWWAYCQRGPDRECSEHAPQELSAPSTHNTNNTAATAPRSATFLFCLRSSARNRSVSIPDSVPAALPAAIADSLM
jgi:hypothetical protein